MVGRRFFVVILVVSGSSTSSILIFRGNSRTFRSSGMLLNGVFMKKLVPFHSFRSFGSSTSSMFIFRGNSRSFRLFNCTHGAHT